MLDILSVGMLPPHPGGSAISLAEILDGLAARAHTIRAIAPITPETALQGEASSDSAHSGVAVTRYLVPWFETNPHAPAPASYRVGQARRLAGLLSALIDQRRPEVVLIGRESVARPMTDIARARRIPVVQRLAGSTTYGLLAGSFPEPLASQLRRALRRADVRVAPGREFATIAARLDIGDVVAVPTGIDLDRFRPSDKDPALLRQLGIAPDDIVVAHVSNLKSCKRPLDVVRSAARALAREPRLLYLIVGDGELRAAMEAECREARVGDRFRFAGWQPYGDMPRYFAAADVVVMPSETEGLSRAYLETQACGRVLVASDIPAAREVVRHRDTGLLSPCGAVDMLSEMTLLAARDPGLRQAIGQRARRQVEKRSVADTVREYEQLLAEAARRRPGSAAASLGAQ